VSTLHGMSLFVLDGSIQCMIAAACGVLFCSHLQDNRGRQQACAKVVRTDLRHTAQTVCVGHSLLGFYCQAVPQLEDCCASSHSAVL
jgi:hypothetical protein